MNHGTHKQKRQDNQTNMCRSNYNVRKLKLMNQIITSRQVCTRHMTATLGGCARPVANVLPCVISGSGAHADDGLGDVQWTLAL